MNKLFEMLNPFQKQEDKPVMKPISETPTSLSVGGVDPKVIGYFEELMKKANLPGPDYFEFKKAVRALANVPEQISFQSTFSTFNVLGVSKEKLMSSIDEYIKIIKDDIAGFQTTVDKKIEVEVTARRKQMEDNSHKVGIMQSQIAELSQSILRLQNEAATEEMAINNTKAAYIATSGSMIQEMEADKNKINQYIL